MTHELCRSFRKSTNHPHQGSSVVAAGQPEAREMVRGAAASGGEETNRPEAPADKRNPKLLGDASHCVEDLRHQMRVFVCVQMTRAYSCTGHAVHLACEFIVKAHAETREYELRDGRRKPGTVHQHQVHAHVQLRI